MPSAWSLLPVYLHTIVAAGTVAELFPVLPIHPLTLAVVGILAVLLPPRLGAVSVWTGTMLYLLLSAVTALEHGWRLQLLVTGQLLAWTFIPGPIVIIRNLTATDQPHWTTRTITAAVTGLRRRATADTPASDDPAPQADADQPHPQHQEHTVVPDEDRFTATLEDDVDTIDDFRD